MNRLSGHHQCRKSPCIWGRHDSLNFVDVFSLKIAGLDQEEDSFVEALHWLVGGPIGMNLEPVDDSANMAGERLIIPLRATGESENHSGN